MDRARVASLRSLVGALGQLERELTFSLTPMPELMERLARQLLGDQNRAEDAVHDTFMKLIRHYDELRDRSDERLASWLLVVVKTTALDMLRRDKWENACEELPEGQSVPADGGEFRALVEIIRRNSEETDSGRAGCCQSDSECTLGYGA